MKLVEIQNSNIRQYYYDVIKELHDIGVEISQQRNIFIMMCNIAMKGR